MSHTSKLDELMESKGMLVTAPGQPPINTGQVIRELSKACRNMAHTLDSIEKAMQRLHSEEARRRPRRRSPKCSSSLASRPGRFASGRTGLVRGVSSPTAKARRIALSSTSARWICRTSKPAMRLGWRCDENELNRPRFRRW